MDIKIGTKYYLRSDRYCCWIGRIIKTKTGENKGKVREDVLGYYRNPEDAFTNLLGYEIRESEAKTLKELKALIEEHTAFIEKHISEYGKGDKE